MMAYWHVGVRRHLSKFCDDNFKSFVLHEFVSLFLPDTIETFSTIGRSLRQQKTSKYTVFFKKRNTRFSAIKPSVMTTAERVKRL